MEENYGASELAKRFGVTRYPAVFVDDILVATPNDFGFYGNQAGPHNGRAAGEIFAALLTLAAPCGI